MDYLTKKIILDLLDLGKQLWEQLDKNNVRNSILSIIINNNMSYLFKFIMYFYLYQLIVIVFQFQ